MTRIYVGPLAGYYWRALRQAGTAPPAAAVEARVAAWRDHVGEGLVRAGHLAQPLSWPESAAADWVGATPTAAALRALKLLVVHHEAGSAPPARLPDRPELDPAWVAAAGRGFADSAWGQVLAPELWLPGEFPFTFRCPCPDGHEVEAGSTGALLAELRALNQQVLRGGDAELAAWAEARPDPAGPLRPLAELAFAIVAHAAQLAVDRGQPMLLHP